LACSAIISDVGGVIAPDFHDGEISLEVSLAGLSGAAATGARGAAGAAAAGTCEASAAGNGSNAGLSVC
jgi:hypothetical protein